MGPGLPSSRGSNGWRESVEETRAIGTNDNELARWINRRRVSDVPQVFYRSRIHRPGSDDLSGDDFALEIPVLRVLTTRENEGACDRQRDSHCMHGDPSIQM